MAIAGFNDTTIMSIIQATTDNTTGSLDLTLYLIFFVIVLIGIIFRVSIEAIALLTTPLIIVLTAFYPSFLPLMMAVIVFDAILLAKSLWFTRS